MSWSRCAQSLPHNMYALEGAKHWKVLTLLPGGCVGMNRYAIGKAPAVTPPVRSSSSCSRCPCAPCGASRCTPSTVYLTDKADESTSTTRWWPVGGIMHCWPGIIACWNPSSRLSYLSYIIVVVLSNIFSSPAHPLLFGFFYLRRPSPRPPSYSAWGSSANDWLCFYIFHQLCTLCTPVCSGSGSFPM